MRSRRSIYSSNTRSNSSVCNSTLVAADGVSMR